MRPHRLRRATVHTSHACLIRRLPLARATGSDERAKPLKATPASRDSVTTSVDVAVDARILVGTLGSSLATQSIRIDAGIP